MGVSVERVTVVRARSWPVIGAGRRLDDLVAVVAANRVVAVSAVAEQAGVEVGLRRREAQRRAPGLEVVAPDPAGEMRAFEAVLGVLDAITPRVEIGEHGVCGFLTRGPSRYFGGDDEMSALVATRVASVLEGATTVHVGTADSRFAAGRAAAAAEPDRARVVPTGQSPGFLSPMPIQALVADLAPGTIRTAVEDLVGVLVRLGLHTLGAFARLEPAEVVGRFGTTGQQAHRWANGHDDRLMAASDPAPELVVSWELDPVVERVDQAAFIARALAQEFIAGLQARGMSSNRVEVHAETEHGESQTRLWRSDQAFSAAAIADRLRWQLDGWLAGPVRQRPTAGLSLLSLRPDTVSASTGRQLGFWGEETGRAQRAARAVARVQGLLGPEAVGVPEVRGGRRPGDTVAVIPADSVDLVERAVAVDRTLIPGRSGFRGDLGRPNAPERADPTTRPRAGPDAVALDGADAGAGAVVDAVAGVQAERAGMPWPGQLPRPAPTIVCDPPIPASLVDLSGVEITVDSRGVLRGTPHTVAIGKQAPAEIVGWSGPWLVDERWWQADGHHRSARMQIVIGGGQAYLIATRSGAWVVEARY